MLMLTLFLKQAQITAVFLHIHILPFQKENDDEYITCSILAFLY